MTDEQIIKALECCHSELGNTCSICPLFDPDNDYCKDEIHKNTLDLINRQKTKNENEIKEIKSEAIKEFAEKLKAEKRLFNCMYSDRDFALAIDNLVKEMTEGKNG